MELIVKYRNRKLYSTKTQAYTTLPELLKKVKNSEAFTVVDHKTKEDITLKCVRSALTHSDLSIDEIRGVLNVSSKV
jgi:polyhydroxyalkanoate synthesis regulator protein